MKIVVLPRSPLYAEKHIKNERCNGPLGLIVYDFIIYLVKGSNRNAPNDKTRFFHIIKNSTLCIGEQLRAGSSLFLSPSFSLSEWQKDECCIMC